MSEYHIYLTLALRSLKLSFVISQLTSLRTMSRSENPHPSLPLLEKIVTEFRDDELEHLDTAVENDAQQAPAHALLSAIIGFGCKGAISIAKRF